MPINKQNSHRFLFLLSLLFYCGITPTLFAEEIPPVIFGTEKVVLVKAIDQARRTFVINKGHQNNIGRHQESFFTTPDASIRARALEVSRYSSLWQVTTQSGTLPFEHNQDIIYTEAANDIWSHLTRAQAYESYQKRMEQRLWVADQYWATKVSFSRALSESITETSAAQSDVRGGVQFEALYNIDAFNIVDIGIGVRLDFEKLVLKEPRLEIPTNRYFLMTELTYNFSPFSLNGDFIYAGVAFGYGLSRTQVDNVINQGPTWVVPSAKLGYSRMIGRNKALVFEVVAESITSTELTIGNLEQKTNIINAKASVGMRF